MLITMNEKIIYKLVGGIFLLCLLLGGGFVYSEIYLTTAQDVDQVGFVVKKGESVGDLSERLVSERIIRRVSFFKFYLSLKGVDKKIQAGEYLVKKPVTVARVVAAFSNPLVLKEKEITIIPGWSLRDIAVYFEEQGLASQDVFFALVGEPAVRKNSEQVFNKLLTQDFKVLKSKPSGVSLEGYIAPDTYRIFVDTSPEDVIIKLVAHRDGQFTEQMYDDIKKSGRSVHEVLTMAGIIEREVRAKKDKAKVADLFWRRFEANWALQADSTVHYLSGKYGNVFTTKEDRDSLNLWNTYKYPGLPPGPISTPDIDSILAAIYPEANDDFYFITTLEGEVKYAEDLEGHNKNVQKYLR